LANDEVGLGIRSCQRLCCSLHVYTYERAPVPCQTYCAYRGSSRLQFSSSLFPSFFPPTTSAPPPPIAAPPLDLQHGLAQHLQQWPKHHTELSERRQFAAAVRCSSKFAHIWPMGRIRSGCPTSQRISERRRQGERFEGSEHRRYVQSTSGVPIVSYSAVFQQTFEAAYDLEAVTDPLSGCTAGARECGWTLPSHNRFTDSIQRAN
jgi:hypothetical protein